MFDKYDSEVELNDRDIKQIKFSDYRDDDYETDFYLSGVVVYLLIMGYTIPIKYLKRALIHLYRTFMVVYSGKNPYALNEYIPKLESLRIEISLLNYAIKHDGSLTDIMHVIKNNINTSDILSGNIRNNNNSAAIIKYIDQNQEEFFDYVYITDSKFPYLDPGVPYTGTLMKGTEWFYTVGYKNGVKRWTEYNSRVLRDNFRFFYPNDNMLEELYGKGFEKFIE